MRKVLGFLFRGKRAIFTGPIFLALLASPYFAGRYFWFHGRSHGTRTGTISKVSIKGPPYCKYVSAELRIAGTGQQLGVIEPWVFTLDDHRPDNPLFKRLEQAERDQQRVTIHYREDDGNKDKPWLLCEQPDHYAEQIE